MSLDDEQIAIGTMSSVNEGLGFLFTQDTVFVGVGFGMVLENHRQVFLRQNIRVAHPVMIAVQTVNERLSFLHT